MDLLTDGVQEQSEEAEGCGGTIHLLHCHLRPEEYGHTKEATEMSATVGGSWGANHELGGQP